MGIETISSTTAVLSPGIGLNGLPSPMGIEIILPPRCLAAIALAAKWPAEPDGD